MAQAVEICFARENPEFKPQSHKRKRNKREREKLN
jgi:hypothetical protein